MRRGGGHDARVGLAVDTLDRDTLDRDAPASTPGQSPVVMALLGGVGAAAIGFLLALAVASLVWLKAGSMSYGSFVHAGTSMWLLAHGASTTLGGVRLGIMPLGLTSLVALMVAGAAGRASTRLAAERDPERPGGSLRPSLRVAALVTLAYLMALVVLGAAGGALGQTISALPGALLLAGGAALLGAGRALGWRPWQAWPLWARAVPRAALAALLTLLAGSAVVAGIALAEDWHRVSALQASMQPGASGGIALLALQVSYLPNLLLWAGSWMLGAGFTLGRGTMVTPVTTHLGFLPSIPVFGAVPAQGSHSQLHLAWLLVGVLAGVLAALTASLSRRATAGETALAGGVSGLAAGLMFVLLGWLSGGAMGSVRLSQMGPRLLPLTLLACSLAGLSGLVAGAVMAVARPDALGDDTPPRDHATDADQFGAGATSLDAELVTPDGDPVPRRRFRRRRGRPVDAAAADGHGRDVEEDARPEVKRRETGVWSADGDGHGDWLAEDAEEPTRDIPGRGRRGGSHQA